jgi:hypothetical protein
MEERTDSEKENFGKVTFTEKDDYDQQISYLTKVYLEELKEPKELLN